MIDPKLEMANLTELETIDGDNPFILHPGEFVLAVTKERVEIPADLVGRLDGKSSLGRLGLIVHSTAGFVDPGFSGRLTLELTNIANLPIMLYYDMPISQISFVRLTTAADNPYGVTSREAEVLRLVAEGLTDRAIGGRLFISHRTVERHVSNLLAKLGAERRSELVATAIREGLLDDDSSAV